MPQLNTDQFIWEYFRDRPWLTTGYAISMMAYPIGVVVLPAIIGMIIDKVKDKLPFAEWQTLFWYMVAFQLVRLAAHIAWFYLDSYMVTDIQSHVRTRVFREVTEAYAYNYRALPVSAVISKVMKLPVAVFEVVREWHHLMIPGVFTMLSLLVYLFWVNRSIGGVMLGAMVAMGIGMYVSSLVCTPRIGTADDDHDALHENIGDVLDNLLPIYLNDATDAEAKRLNEKHVQHQIIMTSARNCGNHFMLGIKLIVIAVAVWLVLKLYWEFTSPKGTISSGQVTAVAMVLVTSSSIIFSMLDSWPRLIYNTSLVKKMEDYLNDMSSRADDTRPKGSASSGGSCGAGGGSGRQPAVLGGPPTCTGLVFDGITFRYPGRDNDVLHNVSFGLLPGDLVRVEGHIGCGKSTIAMLTLGLYRPSQGDVLLCDQVVRQMSRTEIARYVSYIPQNPKLLDRTLFENLTLGNPHSETEVQALLTKHNITFTGLNDPVGKNGSRLSTGQRTLVCLLQAVLRDSPVVICDEVTANMDGDSVTEVLQLINTLAQGRIVLFITHQDVALPFNVVMRVADGAVTTTRSGNNTRRSALQPAYRRR